MRENRVSAKSVVYVKSELPLSVKRTVMTQEVLRVLLNCSTHLPWKRVTELASHMTLKMQYSGYDKYQVVKFRTISVRGDSRKGQGRRKTPLSTKDLEERRLFSMYKMAP